jgi:ribose/xylose/arabinose/galactoside ABC-type transport system permease subunit
MVALRFANLVRPRPPPIVASDKAFFICFRSGCGSAQEMTGLAMRGFSKDRDQIMIEELSGQMRNGTALSRADRLLDAQDDWQSVQLWRRVFLVVVVFLLVGALPGLCRMGTNGMIFIVGLAAIVLFGGLALNHMHRQAFVALEMAKGLSRSEAQALYDRSYASD